MSNVSEYYLVVEFLDEQQEDQIPMAIISNTWIIANCSQSQNYCYWPSYLTQVKLNKLVIDHGELDINKCIKCRINVKYRTAIYPQACQKLKLLEDQSSVSQSSEYESEEHNISKPRIRNRKKNSFLDDFQSDISDDSSNMGPVPPKLVAPVNSFEAPNGEGNTYTLLKSLNQGKDQGQQCQQEAVQSQIMNHDFAVHTAYRKDKMRHDEKHQQANRVSHDMGIQCAGCKKNEGLLLNLLTKVENIGEDIKYLMLSQNVESNVEMNVTLGRCSTKQELEELNFSLMDKERFSSVCNFLRTVGGKDSVDTTRRILNRILTNDLAVSYNWTGRNNKNNFSLLTNIMKLILVSVRKNPLSKNTTQQQVEDTTKLFLRNASDRDGGRDRRKKPDTD